ncbi:hypothetical protein EZV62_023348 [Acer yangbiense]|uniref:Uncharacterized protein n=1 Tax=Acer yangbiense TaxID=1000413 RepID=A0A5C7H1G4_9ROSI|nr:hypothetical protein EZV62_023348 [Acer yangbiense]
MSPSQPEQPTKIKHGMMWWLYDRRVIYDGFLNTYTFSFNSTKIVLLPKKEATGTTPPGENINLLSMAKFEVEVKEIGIMYVLIGRNETETSRVPGKPAESLLREDSPLLFTLLTTISVSKQSSPMRPQKDLALGLDPLRPFTGSHVSLPELLLLLPSKTPLILYKYGKGHTSLNFVELLSNRYSTIDEADLLIFNTFYKLEEKIVDWMSKL